MGDCSKHKKEIAGITDMKLLAEMIGDLHYESLAIMLNHLSNKFMNDGEKDSKANRVKLGDELYSAALSTASLFFHIDQAWQISEQFMKANLSEPKVE